MTEIIVADDQIEVLDMLIRSLRDDTRKVHAFSTGREALSYLQQHPNQIGLAILDLDYGPDEPDGLEILPQMLESVPRPARHYAHRTGHNRYCRGCIAIGRNRLY